MHHMKSISLTSITAISLVWATAALSQEKQYEVTRTLNLSSPVTEVWHVVGDFCDVDDWHPAITACALRVVDGRLHRVLTTQDGAEFIEQRIAVEPGLSYTYRITQSPLPVTRYTATFAVEPLDGTRISWSARFRSNNPEAEAMIGAIFDDGLAAIDAMLD